MDINQQLQPIVAGLIDGLKVSIEQELQAKVTDEVIKKIAGTELDSVVDKLVKQQISLRLDTFNFADTSREQLTAQIAKIITDINKTVVDKANAQIVQEIKRQLNSIDLNLIVNEIVKSSLAGIIKLHNFPSQSIAHTAVNFQGLKLTGDQIVGGIIEQFGSTGIEDRASFVQMTLMDHAVAFEGPLYAPSAEIKGNLIVEGALTLNGTVTEDCPGFTQLVTAASIAVTTGLNDTLFTGYSNIIQEQLKTSGIDLDRITQGGKEIVNGQQLGYHIVDSNLQRVGMIRDLQTSGENLLSETLYVTQRRVGVNTMDPSAVLAVWDEEVELIVAKRRQDVAYIATPRKQQLVLGSNGKENIVLDTDGSAYIENLVVGRVAMSSGVAVPNYAGEMAQIVYNELPAPGSPIGWVCIGGSRWAKFGMIE
jgi:hypothetical protein